MGNTESSPAPAASASAAPAAPKVTVNNIMDEIPMATDKGFPSTTALDVITADPEAVSEGKALYKAKSLQGTLKIYKKKITYMDKNTLRQVAQVIQREWDVEVGDLSSFKMFVASTTEDGWSYDSNTIEELECNSSCTQFLFIMVTWDGNKYNLGICHLKSDVPLQNDMIFAGMIMEGLLGKDEDGRLYFQF